jgi:hypothetical protein
MDQNLIKSLFKYHSDVSPLWSDGENAEANQAAAHMEVGPSATGVSPRPAFATNQSIG